MQSEIPELSVSEFNQSVKMLIEQAIPEVQIRGEISGLARPRSGHLYFTLKDDHSQLRCVMWRDAASRIERTIGQPLRDGDAVHCFGRVDVYVPRGQYQLNVLRLTPEGVGTLQQRFERLKAKLHTEGLFDADRKREIARVPRRIALVTSPTGAAIRDFLQAAGQRWSGVEMVVIPARVQGEGSVNDLVRAIRVAQQMRPKVDTLVVTRGGGSMEDLWSFNEEAVVRALGESTMPTVSAIGHEIDITLCDLVADRRAMTPTDAAVQVLPDRDTMTQLTDQFRQRLDEAMARHLARASEQLDAFSDRPCLARPEEWIRDREQTLDYLEQSVQHASRRILEHNTAELQTLAAGLEALSPLSVLSRGYSVTTDGEGKLVTDAEQLDAGSMIETRFERGSALSVVREAR